MYRKFYADPEDGAHLARRQAAGATARGTYEFCRLSASRSTNSGRSLIVVSCLDNLGKGAAGQAVQNFNHMMGIEEQTALQ